MSARPWLGGGVGGRRGVGGTGGNRPSVDDPRVLAGEVRVAHCRCQLGRRPPLRPAVRGLPCPRLRAVPPALYLPVSVTLVPVLVARCRSPSRSPFPAPGRLQRRAPPPSPPLHRGWPSPAALLGLLLLRALPSARRLVVRCVWGSRKGGGHGGNSQHLPSPGGTGVQVDFWGVCVWEGPSS